MFVSLCVYGIDVVDVVDVVCLCVYGIDVVDVVDVVDVWVVVDACLFVCLWD